jgi:predicted metal-dependent peptidase
MDDKLAKHTQLLVSRAKIAMLESHPFYAHILTHLQFKIEDELPHGTVSATDGRHLFISAVKYAALSKQEQLTALAHEQLHCLDGHLWRRGSRDPLLSNVAQDIYIYHLLKVEKFAVLQDNEAALTAILQKCANGTFTLNDFSKNFWEQIYDAIAPSAAAQAAQAAQGQSGPSQGDDDGDGQATGVPPACGHCYQPAKSPAEAKETAQEWKQWIREAGIYARMAGATPGHWSELVDAATPPVPFESRFAELLKRGLGGDQSYDTFARRHIHNGSYFPSEVIEQMGETIAIVDTSGSRSHEDIAYALGIFRSWREMHPCRFHLVECDSETAGWKTYEEWDVLPAQFEMHGRGGTSFEPPFLQVTERNLNPAVLIFITDGYNYGDFAPKPSYEVLWVLTGDFDEDFAPPYGTVCKVR